jgi:hypothetical protein
MSSLGRHVLQRWLFTQYGRFHSLMHSASFMQPRHTLGFAPRLQIGAVGFVQSAMSLAVHPPHAPLGVHTGLPGQLSGDDLHASQVKVVRLQIGVFPLQPLLSSGLQAAHVPSMHCVPTPFVRSQSLASRQATQAALVPLTLQKGLSPAQAGPAPQPHVRSLQTFAVASEQPCSQSLQCPSVVAMHDPPQHSWSGPQLACVWQATPGPASSSMMTTPVSTPGAGPTCASMCGFGIVTPASSR